MNKGLEDFSIFLQDKLIHIAKEHDDILLLVAYNDLSDAKRSAAVRLSLLNTAEALPGWLNEFYKRGN